ncbi:MAG: peptidoglycan DD-metalloendopeptidase family protein, partial [Ignavibacteriales bacterium]|nr:peptidoglycan DD-metalloendopeptidase family protein [Ignavibacteriales bacterium]
RGKLLSPVRSGSIVRRYGQSTNAVLKTVTINYGIDIKASGDNTVRSAGDGEVSAIDWIPGYGTVVIISHGKDLRTVYGRVTEVLVREGQRVSSGAGIGSISESLEGDILHFEVWNERKSQNPESWIGRF